MNRGGGDTVRRRIVPIAEKTRIFDLPYEIGHIILSSFYLYVLWLIFVNFQIVSSSKESENKLKITPLDLR